MANTILITKIVFIILAFIEGLVPGLIPTWSASCRSSPKILGVANAFAGGVFLAIALMHILPEQIEAWAEYNDDKEPLFPLPELLVFCGYTIILLFDKVLFDTHALFDDHDHEHGEGSNDPATKKLQINLTASMAKSKEVDPNDPVAVKKSMADQRMDVEAAVQSYLKPSDRFAERMKASMGSSKKTGDDEDPQAKLFVDESEVNLAGVSKYILCRVTSSSTTQGPF